MATKQEQNWAIGMHLSLLAGYLIPGAGFVLPPVLWLLKRRESGYLDREGRKALNFLLTLLVLGAVCAVLKLVLIGFFLFWLLGLFGLVMVILAALKTANGEDFHYPLTFTFLR
jgi:uncharacterized Tic20 family protein